MDSGNRPDPPDEILLQDGPRHDLRGRGKSFRAEGRADIIVHAKSKPHAVLELKRGDKPITQDDADQGLSYARMLTPMPPLVIVTNGKDVRFLATHTGADWKPAIVSEAEFAKLVEAASRAASVDIKQAVQVLLGMGNDIWVSAVCQATAMTLEELSGSWDEPFLPFVPDHLIPRKATKQAPALLYRPARAVIVEGAPLSGKSKSALREVALRTADSKDFAVLFIEADGYGPGCIQRLANMLSSTLAWSVSADEVRAWLRQLSIGMSVLALAIDGVGPNNEEVRKDIEELCSTAYGDKNLRMVIAMDDTVAPTFTMNSTQRKYTPLGRAAKEAAVEATPLDDHEFGGAMQVLWHHRIGLFTVLESSGGNAYALGAAHQRRRCCRGPETQERDADGHAAANAWTSPDRLRAAQIQGSGPAPEASGSRQGSA